MTCLLLSLAMLLPPSDAASLVHDGAAHLVIVDGLTLRDLRSGECPNLAALLEDSDAALLNSRTRQDSYDGGRIDRRAYLLAAGSGRRLPRSSEGTEPLDDGRLLYSGLSEIEPYGRLGEALAQAGWRTVASSAFGPDAEDPPDPGMLAIGADRTAEVLDGETLAISRFAEGRKALLVLATDTAGAEAMARTLRTSADASGLPAFVLAMPPRGDAWSEERMSLFLRYGSGPGLLGTATTRRAGVMRITDVCPTILASLGIEPSLDMEGRAAWRRAPRVEGNLRHLSALMEAVRTSEKGRTSLFRTIVRAALFLALFAIAAWPLRRDTARSRVLRCAGLLCLVPVPSFLLCFRWEGGAVAFVEPAMPVLGTGAGSVWAYWFAAGALSFVATMLLDSSLRKSATAGALLGLDDLLWRFTRALGLGLLLYPAALVLPVFTDGANTWGGVYRAACAAFAGGAVLATLPWPRLATGIACAIAPLVFAVDQLTGGNLAAFSFFGYCLARDSRLYGMGNSLCILFVVQTLLLVGVIVGPAPPRGTRRLSRALWGLLLLAPIVFVGAPSLGAQTGGLLYGGFALALAVGIGFGTWRAVLFSVLGAPLLAGLALGIAAGADVLFHKDPTTHFGIALKDLLSGNQEWFRRTMSGRISLSRQRFSYALWWGPIGAAGMLVPWALTAPTSREAPPVAYALAGLATAIFAGATDDSGNVMTAMGCVPCIAAMLLAAALPGERDG